MSSIALKFAIACAMLLWVSAARAEDAQHALSCRVEATESAALRQAPRVARRIETHVLEVVTKKGPQHFRDKPPHDEGGMSGIHWRYCGYNAQAKAHLVEKTDAGLFTGTVFLDDTGRLLEAGHTALFSADGMKFLAIEQDSGVDGETWAVRDTSGKLLWQGYAGTRSKVDGVDVVVSTLERPQWNSQGQLTASVVCISSKATGRAILTRSRSGDWRWRGPLKCSINGSQ